MAKRQIGWAEATRDVVVKLLATGQLPLGGLIAIILLALWRTPNDQMGAFWFAVGSLINFFGGLGYLLAVLTGAGWFLHARSFRRTSETEVRRLAKLRTKEQQPSFKKQLPSSTE